MPKDTLTKFRDALDQLEGCLSQAAQSPAGVDPMLVLAAGALPMVRAAICEAGAGDPGRFDRAFDLVVAFLLGIRGDDRPGLVAVRPEHVAAGGATIGYLDADGCAGRPVAGGLVELENPVSVPSLSDWL